MSVRFDQRAAAANRFQAPQAPPMLPPRREGVMHQLGERLTGGYTQTGYLAAYLDELQENPLRTKMLTSGTLCGLQELVASWIAHDRSKHGHYLNARIPKMAFYGAFISAPLGHLLIGILQKLFEGHSSLTAKILEIIVSNLIVSPIQNAVYLTSMALIAGARTFHQVRATVRAGFLPVMKVSWVASPIALAFAQQFLPQDAWVPFFNLVGFVIGTYINAHTKKKRLEALGRKYGRSQYPRPDYGRPPPGAMGPPPGPMGPPPPMGPGMGPPPPGAYA